MVTRVILVRHCQTQGNAGNIFQGKTDTPLSPAGIYQLGLLAARLKGEKIDKIYASPLGRAMKTAAAINAFHGVPIVEEAALAEIFVGKMDGMDCGEIPKRFPEAARAWNETPWRFQAPEGESMGEVYRRVSTFLEKAVGENPGKTILCTSHGCALRNLICWCKNLPPESLSEVFLGNNTAVSVVEFHENGEKHLCLESDCSHLPPDMVKSRHNFQFHLMEEKR